MVGRSSKEQVDIAQKKEMGNRLFFLKQQKAVMPLVKLTFGGK